MTVAPAVLILALLRALPNSDQPECPHLDRDPSAELLPVSLDGVVASVYGVFEGQLFAFGTSPACAGCQVTATGSFYDPCTNKWQSQSLALGIGFHLDDQARARVGDRVIAMTTALRRNPQLSPASDYTLLESDTRGVVFDLRRRKLQAIPRHEREWRSGDDVIDGYADVRGRYLVYQQRPRGDLARVFVYDVKRSRWAGSFDAPGELGSPLTTPDSDLWFEMISPNDTAPRYLLFSVTSGGTRQSGGPPPVTDSAPGNRSDFEISRYKGIASGSVRMPIERGERRYELRIAVRNVHQSDGCGNVRGYSCDPVVRPSATRLEAAIHLVPRELNALPAAQSAAAQPQSATPPLDPAKRPAASVTPPVVAAGGRVFASSLVRAGDAWALGYYRAKNSIDSDLYLVRFDDDARVLSDTHLGAGIPVSLAWSGDTLGITYSAFENGDYVAYFARVDGQGRLIEESRVRLTQSPCYAPRVVWNAKRQEWGVSWHSSRERQPRAQLTRIAASGVVQGTRELGTMEGIGGAAALMSLRGHYHVLLNPTLRWVEHDGERVVASADLAAQAYEPALVADGEALLASWVEGSKAMVARIDAGEVRSKRALYDAGGGRHIQGLVAAPRATDLLLFWGEHTSAVYNTAIFAARSTGSDTSPPVALDPTGAPQGFPFVATTPERLMLVYQLGDYNAAPQLVARRIDAGQVPEPAVHSHPLLEQALSEQRPSLTDFIGKPGPVGRLPPGGTLPCTQGSSCAKDDRPKPPARKPPERLATLGALSETSVSNVISAARQRLTDCLPKDPRVKGKLVLGFIIDAQGSVTDVHVRQTSIHDEQIASCLSDAVARLRFAPAPGITSVKLPFEAQ